MKNKKRILLAKLLTCWILSKYKRKQLRKFIINFSFDDYIYYKGLNYKIVSLGGFCLPRILTTAAKLKPPKYYGEKSCPFDICIHNDIKKIIECINSDFKNYTDNITYNFSTQFYENKYFDAIYNHDAKLNLHEVKKRYIKRIKNFRDILNEPTKIYFIYSLYYFGNYPTTEDILNLYSSLKAKRRNNEFELILILPQKIEHINNKKIHQIIKDWTMDGTWVDDFFNSEKNGIIKNEQNKEFYEFLKGELNKIIK